MGKEILLTIRILAFNAAVVAIVYLFNRAPEIGQVIIKLPNACANTINLKGKEYLNYECFRYITTAKIVTDSE